MHVVRMRRGWRISTTDNEMVLLRAAVNRGLASLDEEDIEAMPHKVKKILLDDETRRWAAPDGPLVLDEDRRPEAARVVLSRAPLLKVP